MQLTQALAFAVLAAAPCFAHDDDGVKLDRRAPFNGPIWRAGSSSNGFNSALASFPSSGVTLESWIPLNNFASHPSSGSSGWGYVSPSGREYAIYGTSKGSAYVEVTDPANPVILGEIAGPSSIWRDVRTYSHYAYVVSEGGSGVQIVDLAQIDSGVVQQVGSVTTPGPVQTHTIVIDAASGFLYRAGGGGNGLRIYSLADPLNPVFVGDWQVRYVHECTPITYTSGPYAGKQIAFCNTGFNGGWVNPGIDILDVTDKSNITILAHFFYPNAGYSHQSWPSEDRKLLYVDDEYDESTYGIPTTTIVFDIQNLASPQFLGTFTNGNTAIGHNLYVKGNRIFEASYRAGLRIYDASANPIAPTEVAYFDTWAADDLPQFNGLWNVYPFFPSGTVTGSDIDGGLFVWRVAGYPEPTTYCAAKTNSLGCSPTIAFSGSPSASSSIPFAIGATNVLNNKFGLLFYGANPSNAPFHGGTLCVAGPITRTHAQGSGGSASGRDCSGAYSFDFNAYAQSGADPSLAPAIQVRCQYWSRDPSDPSGFFDSLSNALWFSIGL